MQWIGGMGIMFFRLSRHAARGNLRFTVKGDVRKRKFEQVEAEGFRQSMTTEYMGRGR